LDLVEPAPERLYHNNLKTNNSTTLKKLRRIYKNFTTGLWSWNCI